MLPTALFAILAFVVNTSGLVPARQAPTDMHSFVLRKTYDASNFLTSFEFQDSPDIWSDGFARYVSASVAQDVGLFKIQDGKVYLGVEHKTAIDPNSEGRKSIRAHSRDVFSSGLLVGDFEHVPSSVCGIWPAFWTLHDEDPDYSEIDIYEGVSLSSHNEIALFTLPDSCRMDANPSSGHVRNTDCRSPHAGSPACGVDAPEGTFGDTFNAKGGGVWALQLDTNGIKVWVFARANIPSELRDGRPEINTDSWGLPVLDFGRGTCDVNKAFSRMNIILNIDMCGHFAGGRAWETWTRCKQITGFTTCNEYVAKNPSKFQGAYFLVNWIKTFASA